MSIAQRREVPEPIRLADEPGFLLGGLGVTPSLREIRAGDRLKTVEPRVMQVLVALVRAEGAVLSRDDLVERCWRGRIVGDDAINGCVAKVRALACLAGEPVFRIDAVPRVGYRLTLLKPGAAPAAPVPIPQSKRRPPVAPTTALLLGMAAIGVGLGLWLQPSPRR